MSLNQPNLNNIVDSDYKTESVNSLERQSSGLALSQQITIPLIEVVSRPPKPIDKNGNFIPPTPKPTIARARMINAQQQSKRDRIASLNEMPIFHDAAQHTMSDEPSNRTHSKTVMDMKDDGVYENDSDVLQDITLNVELTPNQVKVLKKRFPHTRFNLVTEHDDITSTPYMKAALLLMLHQVDKYVADRNTKIEDHDDQMELIFVGFKTDDLHAAGINSYFSLNPRCAVYHDEQNDIFSCKCTLLEHLEQPCSYCRKATPARCYIIESTIIQDLSVTMFDQLRNHADLIISFAPKFDGPWGHSFCNELTWLRKSDDPHTVILNYNYGQSVEFKGFDRFIRDKYLQSWTWDFRYWNEEFRVMVMSPNYELKKDERLFNMSNIYLSSAYNIHYGLVKTIKRRVEALELDEFIIEIIGQWFMISYITWVDNHPEQITTMVPVDLTLSLQNKMLYTTINKDNLVVAKQKLQSLINASKIYTVDVDATRVYINPQQIAAIILTSFILNMQTSAMLNSFIRTFNEHYQSYNELISGWKPISFIKSATNGLFSTLFSLPTYLIRKAYGVTSADNYDMLKNQLRHVNCELPVRLLDTNSTEMWMRRLEKATMWLLPHSVDAMRLPHIIKQLFVNDKPKIIYGRCNPLLVKPELREDCSISKPDTESCWGNVPQGYVYSTCADEHVTLFNPCSHNAHRAWHNRQLRKFDEQWNITYKVVGPPIMNMIKDITATLQELYPDDICRYSYDQWNQAYPQVKKQEHDRARDQLRNVGETWKSHKDYSRIEGKVKVEKKVGAFKPDIINGSHDCDDCIDDDEDPRAVSGKNKAYDISLGPYIKKYSDLLKKALKQSDLFNGIVTFAVGMNLNELGEWMNTCFNDFDDPNFWDMDQSRYDGHFGEEALGIEHAFYNTFFKDKELMDLLEAQFIKQGSVKCKDGVTKDNIYLKIKEFLARDSGDQNTTLGNSLICLVLQFLCLQLAQSIYKNKRVDIFNIINKKHMRILVGGDDTGMCTNGFHIDKGLHVDLMKQLGFKLKIKHVNWWEMKFYSKIFVPAIVQGRETYILTVPPGKNLATAYVSTKQFDPYLSKLWVSERAKTMADDNRHIDWLSNWHMCKPKVFNSSAKNLIKIADDDMDYKHVGSVGTKSAYYDVWFQSRYGFEAPRFDSLTDMSFGNHEHYLYKVIDRDVIQDEPDLPVLTTKLQVWKDLKSNQNMNKMRHTNRAKIKVSVANHVRKRLRASTHNPLINKPVLEIIIDDCANHCDEDEEKLEVEHTFNGPQLHPPMLTKIVALEPTTVAVTNKTDDYPITQYYNQFSQFGQSLSSFFRNKKIKPPDQIDNYGLDDTEEDLSDQFD